MEKYANHGPRMWWANISGISIIVFAFIVFYLGTQQSFKRHAVGEQLPLTENFNTRAESAAQSPDN